VVLVSSRLVVWVAGIVGFLQVGAISAGGYDPQGLTTPFGNYLANAAVAPLARWDSVWYLTIARSGYEHERYRMVYLPLYPLLIHVVGWVTSSELVGGVLISLVAFTVAMIMLRRLVSLDFDEEIASATVLLIAFSPMAFFFSAVYTESLFLALSVGAFYCARRERWLLAGLLGGLAAMSRNGGIVLILPLAWIYLYGDREVAPSRWAGPTASGVARLLPRNRLRFDVLSLLLVPAGLGVYLLYLGLHYGDGLAPFRAESFWYRHTTFPLTTVGRGVDQAWRGLRQLLHGPGAPHYVDAYAASVIGAACEEILLLGFLLLGVVAFVWGLRRMPIAYSIYTAVALLLALSDPVSPQPLASLPRYEMVIFPFFIWAARQLVRWRLLLPAVAVSAVLLGLCTVEFTTWHWIA
jgi:hypothetical protein